MHDAVGELADDLVARVAEDAEHATVVRQRLGDERVDAAAPRDRGEVLEHDRGEPATLLIVLHREGDFGLLRFGCPVVARDRDDVVTQLGDERHAGVVVHRHEVLEPSRGGARHRREEAHVERLAGETFEESDQRVIVVETNRPQVHGAAVGEDDVGFPFGGVAVIHRHRG